MDYHAHFGLTKTPFTREVAVTELFAHPQRSEVLASLQQVVEQRMSAALVAPAGFGKTVLIRTLCASLPDVRYRVHYLKTSGLSKRDTCREVAKCLGLPEAGSYPRLVRLVQEAVVERSQSEAVRSVLIIDDAHQMRADVLGVLKVLTNYEMDSRLLLSVILVGQGPLERLLERPELEDVAQRLSWYGELRALSREEVDAYVIHRCHVAGAHRELFDERAREAIYEIGRGCVRAIDHLARRSLERAHAASASVVGVSHVIEARGTLRV